MRRSSEHRQQVYSLVAGPRSLVVKGVPAVVLSAGGKPAATVASRNVLAGRATSRRPSHRRTPPASSATWSAPGPVQPASTTVASAGYTSARCLYAVGDVGAGTRSGWQSRAWRCQPNRARQISGLMVPLFGIRPRPSCPNIARFVRCCWARSRSGPSSNHGSFPSKRSPQIDRHQ